MKAVVIKEPGNISLEQVKIPEPEPGFVRIKVKAAAICATDLEVLDGNIPANYPLSPGHEWSGIVDAVGSEEDAHWIGKRVIGSSDVVCLKCEACRSGNWRYCNDFEEIGFKRSGAYAEYAIMPAYGLVELPENVSFAQGALCEPLGVALGTLEKAGAKYGDTCLIMGAGSIGLCMLAAAKAMGLKDIVVVATSDKRLKIAKEMGAVRTIASKDEDVMEVMRKLRPQGTDVVIDATGIEVCIQQCLKLTKKGGEFEKVPTVVFGPFEAPIYRAEGRCRMRFVIKCKLNSDTRALFDALLKKFSVDRQTGNETQISLDFNPTNL